MARYLRKNKNGRKKWLIILIALFVVMAACIGVIIYEIVRQYSHSDFDPSIYHNGETLTDGTESTLPPDPRETTEPPLPVNPINFEDLQAINSDVYAWVYVPDTGVDYPIFQSNQDEDDNYYLHRNIYKDYEFQGVVYTQKGNAKDFSDRVTVVYGHNMLNDSMFSNLDMFLEQDFFDEHPNFYIYTPGHILTYEIVSAHQYDKRHILNSFDFSKDDVFQSWLDMILNPKTFRSHVRDGIELDLDSRIVTLSTCINFGTARYLIQGVLISDEPTQ